MPAHGQSQQIGSFVGQWEQGAIPVNAIGAIITIRAINAIRGAGMMSTVMLIYTSPHKALKHHVVHVHASDA